MSEATSSKEQCSEAAQEGPREDLHCDGWNLKRLLANNADIWKAPQLQRALHDRFGIDITRGFAWKLMAERPRQIRPEHLIALCRIADCDVEDLFRSAPSKRNSPVRETVPATLKLDSRAPAIDL